MIPEELIYDPHTMNPDVPSILNCIETEVADGKAESSTIAGATDFWRNWIDKKLKRVG